LPIKEAGFSVDLNQPVGILPHKP